MKVISLNCRGLGQSLKQAWVRDILKIHSPDVAGFQETKIKAWKDSQIRGLWGCGEGAYSFVESTGNSGGLLTTWDKKKFHCRFVVKDTHFLAVGGSWLGVEGDVGFINVYGPNIPSDRKTLWGKLSNVLCFEGVRWCVFGDFNEVRSKEERLNSEVNLKGMEEFNEFIDKEELVEILMVCKLFTRVSDDGIKMSKLDRFLASFDFCEFWSNLRVKVLERGRSDHAPILLEKDLSDWGSKPFKFFDAWLKEDSLDGVVRDAWKIDVSSGCLDKVLRDKLKNVKLALKEWSKVNFGAIDDQISKFKNECERLESLASSSGWCGEDRVVWLESRKKWLELEEKKREMDRQKAKVKWALEGDENTKFFHASIKGRARKNLIRGLRLNGIWVEDPNKFDKEEGRRPKFFSNKTKEISKDEADFLERPFQEEEVWLAVKACGPNKSPGPDGFNFSFMKRFWNTIKGDVLAALSWFWDKEEISWGCNASFITLIPKVENPVDLGDFRPISLIGVYYKLVTKILAERLKLVIGKVISNNQSAFIKGRQILDGILIANEIVDFAKHKKKEGLVFKVDFEKAYDSSPKNGVCAKWVSWIKACMRSSSVSVLVNGSPTKEFVMGRGLRQGDPLAPFLFLIVAENLNLMVGEAVEKGLYEGFEVGHQAVPIALLQFADDAIFFGKWNLSNLKNLLKILECFKLVSGLKINLNKSQLFGLGVSSVVVNRWALGAGCKGRDGTFHLSWFTGGLCNAKGKSLDSEGINFSGSFRKRIGNGGGTCLWEDKWLGERVLREEFPRLSRLEVKGNCKIVERGEWVDGKWEWRWSWRREPRGRELGELEELQERLVGWEPVRREKDGWVWEWSGDKVFSVGKLKEVILKGVGEGEEGRGGSTLWCKLVPRKINVFIWRLMRGRIPTREVLNNMGIDLDSVLCRRCGEAIENRDHALIGCLEVRGLWKRVERWWNKNLDGVNSLDSFLQEDAGILQASKGRSFWVGVKWSLLYLLWTQRNKVVFSGDRSRLGDCFFEWQRITFEWMARRCPNRHIDCCFNLPQLCWDPELAKAAEAWANQRKDCQMIPSGRCGENMASGPDINGSFAVQMWVDEKSNYDYQANKCKKEPCGHYTQVIWRNTERVGCARVKCDPPDNPCYMNEIYQDKMYQINSSYKAQLMTEHEIKSDLTLQLVFAQRIQTAHALAPGATAPGATASTPLGLPPLCWDKKLEERATAWAHKRKDCEMIHSEGGGENLAKGPNLDAIWAVQMWLDERGNYDVAKNECKHMCGHYTQIVWKDTTKLGCARAQCNPPNEDYYMVVCNYDPPGNYIGVQVEKDYHLWTRTAKTMTAKSDLGGGGFKCEPLFGCEREDNRECDTWRMTRRHVRFTADD
ncbi:hypothetical protein OSB04_030793 [Centaurea solstitialis]|uniref:Reverse transcriptase domain-containing protein n=1 Tax=Centaurea solstitialis TaxID=347529 RepID=A0AA38SKZ3_9ASTR|nr:hypothetical protein OSB04_030793 [Centaurea solstitialis]